MPVVTDRTPGSPSRACLPTSYQVTAKVARFSPEAFSGLPAIACEQPQANKVMDSKIIFVMDVSSRATLYLHRHTRDIKCGYALGANAISRADVARRSTTA